MTARTDRQGPPRGDPAPGHDARRSPDRAAPLRVSVDNRRVDASASSSPSPGPAAPGERHRHRARWTPVRARSSA
ncbi:hypothetical protein EAO68_30245 [Streptomyces sp. wa22]|nr:hypothetical protein EAO68_30245 [Streptomyces sp. wa22]